MSFTVQTVPLFVCLLNLLYKLLYYIFSCCQSLLLLQHHFQDHFRWSTCGLSTHTLQSNWTQSLPLLQRMCTYPINHCNLFLYDGMLVNLQHLRASNCFKMNFPLQSLYSLWDASSLQCPPHHYLFWKQYSRVTVTSSRVSMRED